MHKRIHKKDIYMGFSLLMLSFFFRWVVEHIFLLQYIWLAGIWYMMMVYVHQFLSQHHKEHLRAYGVICLLLLLFCGTLYSFLSAHRLLMGSMRYIILTLLRALDTKFWQHVHRWTSHVSHHNILYLLTGASALVVLSYLSVGIWEQRAFVVVTLALLILLRGNRLLWSSRTIIFKQINIWIVILIWSVFALWQLLTLIIGN